MSTKFFDASRNIEMHFLPAFLAATLLLGGTNQAVFKYKLPLYVMSIIGIALTLTIFRSKWYDIGNLAFKLAVGCFVIGNLIFLIPIPFELWSYLPGRSQIANSINELPYTPHWLPLTLTFASSLYAALALLPCLAIIMLSQRASQKTLNNTILVFLVITTLSAVLGLIQLTSPEQAPYFYEISNQKRPIGLFSNVNHQVCLLAMALGPLLHLVFKTKHYSTGSGSKFGKSRILALSALIICGMTIVLGRSVAGYALSALVLLIFSMQLSYIKGVIVLVIILILAILDFIYFERGLSGVLIELKGSQSNGRPEIYQTTIEMVQDFFPVGAGPAAFQDLYLRYENRENLNNFFINEAHSDWLQIILEYGLFGVLTIVLLIYGVYYQGKRIIAQKASPFIVMVGVSSLIPLLHSAVDYPLRNPSVSGAMIFLFIFTIRGHRPEFAR